MPQKAFPVNLKIPVIQAPMAGGHTTPELIAAVCNAGALGSLGAGYMEPEAIRTAIQKTRTLTKLPFNVNLFAPSTQSPSHEVAAATEALIPIWRELSLDEFEMPFFELPSFEEQVQVLLEENVSIFSFTFGIPSSAILKAFKEKGVVVIGTATTPEEAEKLEAAGVDAIVCQGKEAGGHRGNFSDKDPLYSLEDLLSLSVGRIKLPLIAAGGLMDGAAVASVLEAGAGAAQMGTVFLTTVESGSAALYKQTLLQEPHAPTVLTKTFTGKSARTILNGFIEKMDQHPIADYPIQHLLTRKLRALAAEKGRPDLMAIWAGQGYPLCREISALKLLNEISNFLENPRKY